MFGQKLYDKWFNKKSAPVPPEWQREFQKQLDFESKGNFAAREGLIRADCPYKVGSFEWNHWVYGNDIGWQEYWWEDNPTEPKFMTTTGNYPEPAYVTAQWDAQQKRFNKWKKGKEKKSG